MTPATGPSNEGCFVCESDMDGSGSGSGSGAMGECDSCDDTKFGCCPDNLRAAKGPMGEGCEAIESITFTCKVLIILEVNYIIFGYSRWFRRVGNAGSIHCD